MGFALVGSAGAVTQGSSSAAVTPAWGSGTSQTAGNLLVCHVAVNVNSGLAATPSGWATAAQGASGTSSATIFYKVATGGDAAPTIAAISGAVISARLLEFSVDAGTIPTLDAPARASSSVNASPLIITSGGLDSAPGDLVLTSAAVTYSRSGNVSFGDTYNNGATAVSISNAGRIANGYDFAYGVTTSNTAADSDSFSFTTSNASGASGVIASFTLAPSGPPPDNNGSGGIAVLVPKVSGTGTQVPPTFTGSGGANTPSASASGTGAATLPSTTGSGGAKSPAALAPGSGTVLPPPNTGSGTSVSPVAKTAGSGSTTPPTYTGSGGATNPAAKATGSGSATAPGMSGAGSATAPNAKVTGAGTEIPPAYIGSGTTKAPQATGSGSGTATVPIYVGSGEAASTAATAHGTGYFRSSATLANPGPTDVTINPISADTSVAPMVTLVAVDAIPATAATVDALGATDLSVDINLPALTIGAVVTDVSLDVVKTEVTIA